MVELSKKYPVHLGAAYKSINMEREAIAILEEAHLSKDFFRLSSHTIFAATALIISLCHGLNHKKSNHALKRKIGNMKPSQLRKKEDLQLVISTMRQNNFAPYEEKFNPFADGIRKERFERYYRREQQSFLRVDRDWKDLCEVYGFPYERPTA